MIRVGDIYYYTIVLYVDRYTYFVHIWSILNIHIEWKPCISQIIDIWNAYRKDRKLSIWTVDRLKNRDSMGSIDNCHYLSKINLSTSKNWLICYIIFAVKYNWKFIGSKDGISRTFVSTSNIALYRALFILELCTHLTQTD